MRKKKPNSQPNSNKDLNSNLGPINLEAPKIYRNSQSKQGGKANQTVNQKRTRQNKKRRLKNSVRKFILLKKLTKLRTEHSSATKNPNHLSFLQSNGRSYQNTFLKNQRLDVLCLFRSKEALHLHRLNASLR